LSTLKVIESFGLEPQKMPCHVAVIMDGNGRWAKKRFLPRLAGHRAGVKSVRSAVELCGELGIGYLTLYAFSTENWKRPAKEVSALMSLLVEYLKKEVAELNAKNVRLNAVGRIQDLDKPVYDELLRAIDTLSSNTGLTLTLALNYGSRTEIIDALKKALSICLQNNAEPNTIDEKFFSSCLYTADIPDPDLLIRTSGEMRISNFLLWQIAYTELYVTDQFWPDFNKVSLINALKDYQARNRRFGGLEK
jgi:undecaprenyl diphosphate synthase